MHRRVLLLDTRGLSCWAQTRQKTTSKCKFWPIRPCTPHNTCIGHSRGMYHRYNYYCSCITCDQSNRAASVLVSRSHALRCLPPEQMIPFPRSTRHCANRRVTSQPECARTHVLSHTQRTKVLRVSARVISQYVHPSWRGTCLV